MEVGCLWEMGKVAEVGEDPGLCVRVEKTGRVAATALLATRSYCLACSAVTGSL